MLTRVLRPEAKAETADFFLRETCLIAVEELNKYLW